MSARYGVDAEGYGGRTRELVRVMAKGTATGALPEVVLRGA